MSSNDNVRPAAARRYRIRIEGRLREGFADALDGVEQQDDAGGTTFTGTLVDVSQVFGVIDYLRQLGVEIVAFDSEPITETAPEDEVCNEST